MAGSRESRADGVRMGTNNAVPDAEADAATAAEKLLSLSSSGGGSMQLFVPDDDDVFERFRLIPEDSFSRVCGWMFRRVGMRGKLHSTEWFVMMMMVKTVPRQNGGNGPSQNEVAGSGKGERQTL